MTRFKDFAAARVPENGYYSKAEQYWLIRPKNDWQIHDCDSWLEIGGPGVDGILWALRRGEDGVFAHYPIEGRFEWKAKDVESLIIGWLEGRITV
jgi:hypothetical protein